MAIPAITPNITPGLTSLGQAQSQPAPAPVSSTTGQIGQTFDQMLSSLNSSDTSSNDLVQQLSMGNNVDLHNVMINMQENDVNFRVALAIRDKLVSAYQEVMRMQV